MISNFSDTSDRVTYMYMTVSCAGSFLPSRASWGTSKFTHRICELRPYHPVFSESSSAGAIDIHGIWWICRLVSNSRLRITVLCLIASTGSRLPHFVGVKPNCRQAFVKSSAVPYPLHPDYMSTLLQSLCVLGMRLQFFFFFVFFSL